MWVYITTSEILSSHKHTHILYGPDMCVCVCSTVTMYARTQHVCTVWVDTLLNAFAFICLAFYDLFMSTFAIVSNVILRERARVVVRLFVCMNFCITNITTVYWGKYSRQRNFFLMIMLAYLSLLLIFRIFFFCTTATSFLALLFLFCSCHQHLYVMLKHMVMLTSVLLLIRLCKAYQSSNHSPICSYFAILS